MPAAAMTEEDFARAWAKSGGRPSVMAKDTGLTVTAIMGRRSRLAARGTVLHTAEAVSEFQGGTPVRRWTPLAMQSAQRLNLEVRDGIVIVFSDAHYWPGLVSVSHRALLVLIDQLRPKAIIANGDVLDGCRISRHDRIGWEQRPTLKQELGAAQDRLGEVETAADAISCKALVWTLGNHDARFENYLSKNAPEFEGLPGSTLPEHFPRWDFGMSAVINTGSDHPVMVKHRQANGVHAAYNNTLRGGGVRGHGPPSPPPHLVVGRLPRSALRRRYRNAGLSLWPAVHLHRRRADIGRRGFRGPDLQGRQAAAARAR